MRGTVAKRLRRKIYGDAISPRGRRLVITPDGQIMDSQYRMAYQHLKRVHKRGQMKGLMQ